MGDKALSCQLGPKAECGNLPAAHLQEDVPLSELGTARVVHDLLHHRTHRRLACRNEGCVLDECIRGIPQLKLPGENLSGKLEMD